MSSGFTPFSKSADAAVAAHSAFTTGVHGITVAGAALIDDATAADQRTTMGVAYGTTDSTVCVGNDYRLSNARTPTSHASTHNAGGADALAVDAAAATGSLRTLGTSSTSACAGNDSRLSDARTPVAHNQAWSTITATPTTISGYGLTDAASTGANTFTGAQLIRAAATQDAIEILGRAGGTSSFKATITPLALSASHTFSLPDEIGTIALRGPNTFIGTQIIQGTITSGAHIINTGSAANVYFAFTNGGVSRWTVAMGGSETGSNAGSDLYFNNFNDAGDQIATALMIKRNTGDVIANSTTESSSKDTGSIVAKGGIGVEKSIVAGGSVNIGSGQGYKVAGTKVVGGQASAIADISTADATDLASAIALANANKSKTNSTLAMIRTHGLIAT